MKFKAWDRIVAKKASNKASGMIQAIEGSRYNIIWDNRPYQSEFDTLYNYYELIDAVYELSPQQIRDEKLKELLNEV